MVVLVTLAEVKNREGGEESAGQRKELMLPRVVKVILPQCHQ